MRFRTAFALVMLGVAAVAVGCDGTEAPTAGTTGTPSIEETAAPTMAPTAAPTETPSPALPAAGAACSLGPSGAFVAGETTSGAITSGGRERTFHLYVPSAYDGSAELPLVMNFHGLGSNGGAQHLYAGFVPIAEREGFFVVSPNGVNNSWLITPGVNDIEFARDLVASLAEEVCIDTGAVFSTGMSNGGFISAALACVAADLVAAVAPVAGVLGATANCGEPVPMLQFHGTNDFVVPYAPGIISVTGGPFAGIEAIMASWGEQNRCDGERAVTAVSESVELVEFSGCAAPTGHYVVNGGGHTWPGGPAVERLGLTTQEISASELIWEFFAANRR